MKIYCIQCSKDVEARLTTGKEVYLLTRVFDNIPFWMCDMCNNFVGCHHKTKNPTKPLGVIATGEVKRIRMEIHKKIDSIIGSGIYSKNTLYETLSNKLGYTYHTAEIRSSGDGYKILEILESII